jgi:hypothetical protein
MVYFFGCEEGVFVDGGSGLRKRKRVGIRRLVGCSSQGIEI